MSKRQTGSTFEDSPEFGEPARKNNYIEESQQSFYDPTLTSTTTNLDQDETLPPLAQVMTLTKLIPYKKIFRVLLS